MGTRIPYSEYSFRFPDNYNPYSYYKTEEIFIEIPDIVYSIYPFNIKRYMISNWGRIYDKINKSYRPIIDINRTTNIYIRFELKDLNNNIILVPAHRLVLMSFIGIPVFTYNAYANHIDGVRWHNELYNLEWVTNSENAIHAYKNKLNKAQGGDHEYAKLTNDQYHEICRLTQEGYMPKEINKIMNIGIDVTHIAYGIRAGVSQKYISAQYDFSSIYHNKYHRISDSDVITICKLLEKGIYDPNIIINKLDISENSDVDKAEIIRKINNIKNRITFKEISKNYNF